MITKTTEGFEGSINALQRTTDVPPARIFLGRLLIVFLCGSVVSKLHGDPLEHWHKRAPLPLGGDLYAVTYGGGVYVAVGQGIETSPDGLIWTDRSLDILDYFRSIIYFRDQFIIAGPRWISPDGTQWTQPNAPVPSGGVAYGNGLFVTIAWEGSVATSSDGINWTPQDLGAGNSLGSICFGNGTFVGTGPAGTVLASTNGTNWSAHDVPTASLLGGVAFGNGMFVAAGRSGSYSNEIWTSADGRNWLSITHPMGAGLSGIAFGNGTFVCVGDSGFILSSTNGADWYDVSLPIYGLYAVAYGTNGFVAVGSDGTTLYSKNGFQWRKINSGPGTELNAVAYGGGLFVAVGKDGPLSISTNGVRWFENPVPSDLLVDVTFGSNRFVAVGEDSLFTSVDGKQWTNHFAWGDLAAVAYGDGNFVAVAENQFARTSFDGINWGNVDIPADIHLNSVTFGNGLFVAGGNAGVVLTSTNGTNWIKIDIGVARDIRDLAYGNGRFVAVCGLGGIMHSQDGIHWIDADMSNNSNWLASVTFAWGTFVVGGGGGVILTSTSADSWTRINSGTSAFFKSIAYGSNSFVAVADGIRQSDPWPDPPHLQATFNFAFGFPVQLKLTGDVGRSYQIEGADELSGSWQPLVLLPVTTNPVYWTDPQSTNLQKRFYRAVLLH